MQLIPSFFRRARRRRDDLFGDLIYMGDRARYWEGKIEFPPSASNINIFVDGSADDSMEEQQRFFRWIVEHWPVLKQRIEPKLRERLSQFTNSKSDAFTISSLSIPKASGLTDAEWEVSFYPATEQTFLLTVHLKGDAPGEIDVDD